MDTQGLMEELCQRLVGEKMAALTAERDEANASVFRMRMAMEKAQQAAALAKSELYQFKHGDLAPRCGICAKRIEDRDREPDEA